MFNLKSARGLSARQQYLIRGGFNIDPENPIPPDLPLNTRSTGSGAPGQMPDEEKDS